MAAVGNLNDFVKYQMAQGLATGGSGAAALGAEMAVGLSMAQQMFHPSTGVSLVAGNLHPSAGARGALSNVEGQVSGASGDVLTPADAAKLLNVSEADVIASLEAGDLKGKKIGSQWRLTRAQLAQFMQ
jgi:excisionase family DNA binding protein